MSETPKSDPSDLNKKHKPGATQIVVGVVGADLRKEDRDIPSGAPPQWGDNAGLSQVGRRTPRLDGVDKVTGRARYAFDVQRKGMLHGRVLRSPHPSARIRSIDTSAAEAMEGVKAVHILAHLLSSADEVDEVAEPGPKKKARTYPRVRYAGQPIAAVAATSAARATEALGKIRVDYEVLPFVVDPDDALKPEAPLVFGKPVRMAGSAGGGGVGAVLPQNGNVRGPKKGSAPAQDPAKARDAVEAALKSAKATAAVVVQQTYRTQVQTHSALETHGLVAEWGPGNDELTVWASTQGLYSVRDELAEVLEIPQSKIRVIMDFCGGGFGAKFGAGNYGVLAAHLARKAKAPVRIFLDRHEEHLGVGNRPGSEQTVTVAAGKDGKLLALRVTGWGSGGAGAGAGFAGPVQNLYACPAVYTEESDVFTHTGPLAAFRAPGHPQGAFALEQAIDELAERLGMDPLIVRERNDPHPTRKVERQRGAQMIAWAKRHPAGKGPREGTDGAIRRGVGMAQGVWYHLISLNSHAEVRIHKDGAVELLVGVQDIGGGIRTPMAQVVAEELGLSTAAIQVTLGDTRLPPGPASGGSVTTASITPAVRDAAYAARQALCRELAAVLSVDAAAVGLTGGKVSVVGTGGKSELSWKQAAGKMRKDSVSGTGERRLDYGGFLRGPLGKPPDQRGVGYGQLGGVQFAEVTVDTITGVVRVERVVAAQDCGRPMNPMLTESQIKGGVIQGVSYALFEERRFDRRTGLLLNGNLEQYKIAGSKDTPRIDVVLLEELRGRSSTDAAGIGEPATVPTAAAVANAVYNAIGVRVRELPITPARVLAALAAGKASANGGTR